MDMFRPLGFEIALIHSHVEKRSYFKIMGYFFGIFTNWSQLIRSKIGLLILVAFRHHQRMVCLFSALSLKKPFFGPWNEVALSH